MHYFAIVIFLSIVFFAISSCNWHLCNYIKLPDRIKVMVFDSSEYNNPIDNSIINQLRIKGIKLIEKNSFLDQKVPLLRIISSTLTQETMNIFQNGITAEYRIVMLVNASLSIPNQGIYPITSKVCRSFFNDSRIALAKNAEQQSIINEMYSKTAEELIRKLSNIQITNKKEINDKQPILKENCSISTTY